MKALGLPISRVLLPFSTVSHTGTYASWLTTLAGREPRIATLATATICWFAGSQCSRGSHDEKPRAGTPGPGRLACSPGPTYVGHKRGLPVVPSGSRGYRGSPAVPPPSTCLYPRLKWHVNAEQAYKRFPRGSARRQKQRQHIAVRRVCA